MLPMLETSFDCAMKSLESNSAFAIYSRIHAAPALVTSVEAFSTREIMLPMPRMHDAIRSGQKGSRSCARSLSPANFIGFPDMPRMETVAPPWELPSSLVRIWLRRQRRWRR
jgi:hypothetical protein